MLFGFGLRLNMFFSDNTSSAALPSGFSRRDRLIKACLDQDAKDFRYRKTAILVTLAQADDLLFHLLRDRKAHLLVAIHRLPPFRCTTGELAWAHYSAPLVNCQDEFLKKFTSFFRRFTFTSLMNRDILTTKEVAVCLLTSLDLASQ